MRIVCHNGMVNIDSKYFAYGNIKSMYTTGDGHGLQVSENMESNRSRLLELCSEIADRLYEIQEIEKRHSLTTVEGDKLQVSTEQHHGSL